MKTRYILSSLFAAGLLLGSCDNRLIPDWPDDGYGRNRNPEPIAMSYAEAAFFGHEYNEATENSTLFLSYGEYNEDLSFKGEGMELALDILCPAGTGLAISPGQYSCSVDDLKAGVFLTGYEDNGLSYPSYIYKKDKKGKETLELVTGGTLSVEVNTRPANYIYNITANIKAGTSRYIFTYEGTIDFTDYTEPVGPEAPELLSNAYANFNGKQYSDDTQNYTAVLSNGTYDADNNFIGSGTELALDFLCPISATDGISAGSYSCTYDDFKAFVFLEGYEEEGTVYPSYLYEVTDNGDEILNAVTGGSVTVARQNGKYRIDAELEVGGATRKFSFEGNIQINDYSASDAPAMKKAGVKRLSGAVSRSVPETSSQVVRNRIMKKSSSAKRARMI